MDDTIKSWLRYSRKKLGITHAELSRLFGITQSAISLTEKSEEKGSIQLKTMKKFAEAMNCNFSYCITPKGFKSFEEYIENKALEKAKNNLEKEAKKMNVDLKTEEQKQFFLEILQKKYLSELSAK